MEKTIFKEMVDRWPSAIVARTEVNKFSGGAMKERYIANLDAANLGPEGRFRIGRRICYPAIELARWLEGRSSKVGLRKSNE
jgi:hypothetical protein